MKMHVILNFKVDYICIRPRKIAFPTKWKKWTFSMKGCEKYCREILRNTQITWAFRAWKKSQLLLILVKKKCGHLKNYEVWNNMFVSLYLKICAFSFGCPDPLFTFLLKNIHCIMTNSFGKSHNLSPCFWFQAILMKQAFVFWKGSMFWTLWGSACSL